MPGFETYSHRKRTGSMLCYPYEEKRLESKSFRNAWNCYPVGTQPKLDGERCREESGVLLSSTEDIIYSVPHINEALAKLKFPFEPDGELYVHGMDFEDIHSIVSRTVNLHENHETMEYHVFDIATDDTNLNQAQRYATMKEFFKTNVPSDSPIKLVPMQIVHSLDAVMQQYDQYVMDNYEGIIIRHLFAPYIRCRSTNIMKFKPKKRDDYEIIGFTEEHDKFGTPKNRLGTLTCVGASGDVFDVYSGFDDNLREVLWAKRHNDLVGRFITVHYQNIGTGGVPKFGRVVQSEIRTVWEIN